MFAYSGESATEDLTTFTAILAVVVAAACFLILAFWKR